MMIMMMIVIVIVIVIIVVVVVEPHLGQPLRHPEHAGANGNHMPQNNQPQMSHQNGGPPLNHAPNGIPVPQNPSANDCHILSDLNFDPATIIDGDAGTQSGLDVS